MRTHEHSGWHYAVWLICAGILVAFLYFGRELLIPVALAAFLCSLLAPAVRRVERLPIGRSTSVLVVVGASCLVIGAIVWLFASQAAGLVRDLPIYRDNIISKSRSLTTSVSSRVGKASEAVEGFVNEVKGRSSSESLPAGRGTSPSDVSRRRDREPKPTTSDDELRQTQVEPVKVEVVGSRDDLIQFALSLFWPVVHPLATTGITAILVIFFLIHQADLRDRIIRLCGRARISVTTATLLDCERRVTRYLLAQAMANGLIGLAIGVGLFALGIPNSALWGMFAAILRFIPYLGGFLAALLPVAMAIAISDGWTVPIYTAMWCALVEVLGAYALEPWLYGSRTGVAPTAILFAFLFWTWLWGGIGLFLATPITVCFVVLGKHIPAFEVFYILLSDEAALAPQTRFYQRLLALDGEEAISLADQYAAEKSPAMACDEMILPALAELEREHASDLLDEERIEFVHKTIHDLIDKLAPGDKQVDGTPNGKLNGPLVALNHGTGRFDSLVARLAMELTPEPLLTWSHLSSTGLTNALAKELCRIQPAAFVFATTRPGDLGRIKLAARQFVDAGWTGPIHVLLITSSNRPWRDISRLLRNTNAVVHSSLHELAVQLRLQLAESATHEPAKPQGHPEFISLSPGLG